MDTSSRHAERALDLFRQSFHCSQAVLEAFASEMGLPEEYARKIGAPFGGGMASGSVCGAVTGAIMVIGLKYGKTKGSDTAADKRTFGRVSKFIAAFEREHESIYCSRLLEMDMSTAEGIRQASKSGLFKSRCPKFVETAADLLDQIL